MKNHFFICYFGNKRKETPHIYQTFINDNRYDNISVIVEPFCGSCALSYYISTKEPRKYTYILNDNNKHLIELLKIAKSKRKLKKLSDQINDIAKTLEAEEGQPNTKQRHIYNNFIKDDGIVPWFIKNKIYKIRPGLFPTKYKYKYIDLESCPIVNFFRTEKVILTSKCGIDTLKKYHNKKDHMIFMDPPYLSACNDFYYDSKTNIYQYLFYNDINDMKAIIMLCLEKIWIIDLLFDTKNRKYHSYDKKYEVGEKRKTTHIIITNELDI